LIPGASSTPSRPGGSSIRREPSTIAVSGSTRTPAAQARKVTVTASPGPDPEPPWSRLLVTISHQQRGHVSARVPGAECLRDERAGGPRPLRPPARPRHALPDRWPSHQCTRFPGRPRPGNHAGPPGGHRNARPTQRRASSQHTPPARPVVPSVEDPAVTPTALPARNPSAMRPWASGSGATESTDGHGRRGQERCADRPQERCAGRSASLPGF
jgi:hypothetical protein